MTGKVFFLFPGQGAQYPGMALDLLEKSSRTTGDKIKQLFSLASEIAGKDMAALLRDSDPETLKRTDISQPAITLANLAAAAYARCHEEKRIEPAGCAGFSLGEYAALAAAGVITEEECFRLVTERGKIMQAAIERLGDGAGMAAVMGLVPEKVESLIAEWKIHDLYAANINSPRQCVVAGSARALTEAEGLFTKAGAKRFIRLAVAGPFHSPLMAEAAEEFGPFLEKAAFKDPAIPLFSNVSGKQVSSGEEAKKMALAHITSPVRWVEEEAAITASTGIDALLETGPGKVLQGLWRDSGSTLPCCAAGTVADIEKFFEQEGH